MQDESTTPAAPSRGHAGAALTGPRADVAKGRRPWGFVAHFAAAACIRSTLVRGLKFSLIVGPILTAINQYDAFADQHFPAKFYIKLALTFLVPFLVSVCSSTIANLNREAPRGQAD